MVQKYRDLASRAAWTALQAGLGVIGVEALGLPLWLAAPVAMGLSALKSYVATHVGDPETVEFDG